MKHTRHLAVAAVAALALAACTAPSDDPGDSDGTDATAGSADGAFPATVDTKFGEVTIDEQPERVVALGWGDAETAISLGTQPVAASDWLGFGGDGVGPWSAGYDESPEIIDTMEPSYEAVAAAQPDLILDVRSSGDQERYDRLSQIAPTVGVPAGGENYLTTTEQQTTMIAEALGVPEKGEKQLSDLAEAFTATAADHPEWKGMTATAATRTAEGWGAYVAGDARMDFLTRLGFAPTPQISDLGSEAANFSVDISDEQLDLLDADLLVAFPIFIEQSQITDDPQWQSIPAVQAGRDVVIDGDLLNAYSLGTPEAQQYALEKMVPQIEEALAS